MSLCIIFLLLGLESDPGAGPSSEPAQIESAVDESRPVEVPEPSEKAVRYARGNLALWFVNHLWAVLVPTFVFVSGLAVKMRDLAVRIGRRWPIAVAIFIVLYLGLVALIDLPIDWYEGFVRQHAYGLSMKSPEHWFGDRLKALGFTLALAALFAWIPVGIMRRAPRTWWIWTGLLCVPYLLGSALLKPVVFDPAFNHFGAMRDKQLETEVLGLASRAGIDGSRVFEVDKGRDTTAVNAYVTGLFGTKRIVVWDTLLAKLNGKQVLFVVAHEIGHYVLGHVVKGLLVSAGLILLGLGLVHIAGMRLIDRLGGRWGIDRPSDLAAIPLLIAIGQIVSLGLHPIGDAYSRYIEHQADRFALELTRANHTGASSFVALQRANLSLPRPDPFTRIWRSTHPSLGDRIDFCNNYHPWRTDAGERAAPQSPPKSVMTTK
jgi:STE24 endopeptidase